MASTTRRAAAPKPSGRGSHTIRNAANSNERRRLLVALRNKIADDLDSGRVASRDLASLSKRLMDIAASIEAIDKGASKTNPVAMALEVEDEPMEDADGED
ncbi:hypothetical protein [Bifidobacterium longum]|jgi:hypothetical protein|uniref:hypothetical protein n=1 Tax=Bifidobacterium longum TaxID=216816 RepID=UPI001F32E7F7|nr:hypothetical protein [Bifidobacterium longum]DAM13804.1 MAG TPA: hypothetical protein [Caudoviricetes sp.]